MRLAQPLRLRGGGSITQPMTFHQGVLAAAGSVVTLSGVATVLDPAWTRATSEHGQKWWTRKAKKTVEETAQERVVSNLLGLALLGWGVGKLSVRRGYERAYMQLNCIPMVGSLAVAGKRFGPAAFWFQAVTAALYAVIGFKPRPRGSQETRFFEYLPEQRVYRA